MLTFRKTVAYTPAEADKAERNTICSACCTSLGDVPFCDAAIIIIYANMLGADEMVSMITTSLSPLAIGLAGLWSTMLAGRQNYQKTILQATAASLILFAFIVLAPFFGSWSVGVLLIALTLYSVCNTFYISAWFPLLSSFLTPQRRSFYLGKMRFSWQLSSASFLFIIGLIIGKNPPVHYIQYVMFISLLIYACRMFFIASVPTFEQTAEIPSRKFSFKEGLQKALENKPLTGFSVYTFVLNLAAYGTVPLVTLYLKKALDAPDNVIVLLSSVTLCGMLTGSLFAGKMLKSMGTKKVLLLIHITFAVVNFLLFMLGRDLLPLPALYTVIGALLFTDSFMLACSDITSSSEMMKLATPGNTMVAMAFFNSFNYSGRGISRLLSSLILGSGALALYWNFGGMTITHYQTLFLVYALFVMFAGTLLVVVPAIFPHGEFVYREEGNDQNGGSSMRLPDEASNSSH